jgi:hypothetical protein
MEQQFKEIWFEVWEGSVVQYAGNKSCMTILPALVNI